MSLWIFQQVSKDPPNRIKPNNSIEVFSIWGTNVTKARNYCIINDHEGASWHQAQHELWRGISIRIFKITLSGLYGVTDHEVDLLLHMMWDGWHGMVWKDLQERVMLLSGGSGEGTVVPISRIFDNIKSCEKTARGIAIDELTTPRIWQKQQQLHHRPFLWYQNGANGKVHNKSI